MGKKRRRWRETLQSAYQNKSKGSIYLTSQQLAASTADEEIVKVAGLGGL